MRNFGRLVVLIILCLALASCSSQPVPLGTIIHDAGSIPVGKERYVSARGCGFQLFLLIPIRINDRAQRAYKAIERQAAGDFITNIEIQEEWRYGFLGTVYCTRINAKAISRDGMYLSSGNALQNDAHTVALFKKAAEQGNEEAQKDLAIMYYKGKGVPQDFRQAYIWFSVAAANGQKDAAKNRDTVAGQLTPESLGQAQKQARLLFEKIEANKMDKTEHPPYHP